MPVKRRWTEAENTLVLRMAEAGCSSQLIAKLIGISRTAARLHVSALGSPRFIRPEVRKEQAPIDRGNRVGDDRMPLPPGSPETWGVIVAGTCLEGVEYGP